MPAESQVLLPLITVLGAVVTILGLVIRAYLKRIETHVNHVEDDLHTPSMTLGQRVKKISDKQDEFIVTNEEQHSRIWDKLDKLPPRWLLERLDHLEDTVDKKCDDPKA